MWPSAPRVCSEPGGQKPVLSLSLDLIKSGRNMAKWNFKEYGKDMSHEVYIENSVFQMKKNLI